MSNLINKSSEIAYILHVHVNRIIQMHLQEMRELQLTTIKSVKKN